MGQEVAAPWSMPALVSTMLEARHREVCQHAAPADIGPQIAGLSQEERRLSEGMVQIQTGVGKTAAFRLADAADIRAQLSEPMAAV